MDRYSIILGKKYPTQSPEQEKKPPHVAKSNAAEDYERYLTSLRLSNGLTGIGTTAGGMTGMYYGGYQGVTGISGLTGVTVYNRGTDSSGFSHRRDASNRPPPLPSIDFAMAIGQNIHFEEPNINRSNTSVPSQKNSIHIYQSPKDKLIQSTINFMKKYFPLQWYEADGNEQWSTISWKSALTGNHKPKLRLGAVK
jgi:hypothetical protein